MNKIPRPVVDDCVSIDALSNNSGVSSYPLLKAELDKIKLAYEIYEKSCGNVLKMPTSFGISTIADNALRGHYQSPPKDLNFINSLREEYENRTCPMCGSFHVGTLDHVLPKSDYGVFSVLSINLVPSCKCNLRRGTKTRGSEVGQRVLHPYFDACLSERLVRARFDNLGEIPEIFVESIKPATDPDYAAIEFHLKMVVEKNGIRKWLSDQWIKFCMQPNRVIRELRTAPKSACELKEMLENELKILDEYHESKNNWGSIFVVGLLEINVRNWILARILANGGLVDVPII